ncbi:sugar ABC transporter permease, partial [Alphaproteobacteria bacterium]|nr:sugar ABC transporter permease [Alphaproteobacteria bacterium]
MSHTSRSEFQGVLARREKRLAYLLLLPTFMLVLAIVLLPLVANFWISFKPVTLGDLRPPSLVIKEAARGTIAAPGDVFRIEYRFRNSSMKYPLVDTSLRDTLPNGFTITALDPACEIVSAAGARNIVCTLGDLDAKARGKLVIEAVLEDPLLTSKDILKASKPETVFTAQNVMTSFDFTIENFEKVFSAAEFWDVLKTSVYYTVFGTAGALLFGLFAAQIMQKTFPGRSVIRGLLLFPYVAPVIAVAFSWVVLFDPFSGVVNAMLLQAGVAEGPINFFGQRKVDISLFGLTIGFPVALSMVILFEVWRYFPLSFLFILARMQSIPADIYEAAEMDGATPLQQFRFLSLPFIAGILAVLFLLRFIWTFNKFDDIFLLTGGN